MHRSSYYYRPQRKRSGVSSYIMPFMILIAVGLILILGWKLWKMIFKEESMDGAYVHIVDGSIQLKTWGTDEFFDLSSDVLVLHGDEIRTSADAQLIVEFFDGTIMRLGGNTTVVFQDIDSESKVPMVELLMVDGQAWFNKVYKSTMGTQFVVKMDNVNVVSEGSSIFAVDNDFEEAVRVIHGSEVGVEVLSEDDDKIVEEAEIGVGQEMVFTEEVLDKYWKFQSPSVLSGVAQEFKDSEWYDWNIDEDKNPTEFVKTAGGDSQFVEVAPEVMGGDDEDAEGETTDEETEVTEEETSTEEEQTSTEEETAPTGGSGAPTITSVAGVTTKNAQGFYVVTSRVATLTGTVSAGAAQVVVNDYTLTQFKAGDTTWSYYANADFGLMKPGENTYVVYTVDAEGKKSATLTVKVMYNPPAVSNPPANNDDEEDAAKPEDDEGTEKPDWLTEL